MDVSAGQRRINVPNVVGMDREAAQLALEKVGLEVGSVAEHESPLPRGEVMTTSPVAGTALILPSSVAFVVSAGPATIEVPYLVGRPFGEARAALEQLGLTAQTASVDSASNEPEGVVTIANSHGRDRRWRRDVGCADRFPRIAFTVITRP